MPDRSCSVATCEHPARVRELCAAHYMRLRRQGVVSPEIPVRVMSSRDGVCSVEGCETKIRTIGMCKKHYARWYRHGGTNSLRAVSAEDRFWPYVAKSDGCWVWTRYCSPTGYGRFAWEGGSIASRFSWIVTYGPIPDGLDVLHHCDNPPCVRPDHLFLGTDADNAADKTAKGRGNNYSGGPRGRKLTWALVEEIRAQRYVLSIRELSVKYGVSMATIWNIHDVRTWDPAKRRSQDT